MKFTKFEDCEVWQMGRVLVGEIYALTRDGCAGFWVEGSDSGGSD